MSDRECRLGENSQISERKEKQWRGGWKEEGKEGGNKRMKARNEERDKRVTKDLLTDCVHNRLLTCAAFFNASTCA